MNKRELLYKYAREFRDAIDKVINDGLSDEEFFKSFPKNKCGISSDLLGQYFMDNGILAWYICGRKEDGKTHAWLATSNPEETKYFYIIDITSDQFGKGHYDVYVNGINDFYKSYNIEYTRKCYSLGDISGVYNYIKIYDEICGCLVR